MKYRRNAKHNRTIIWLNVFVYVSVCACVCMYHCIREGVEIDCLHLQMVSLRERENYSTTELNLYTITI